MQRVLYNVLRWLAIVSKIFNHRLYMRLIVKAYRVGGANIIGTPAYIDSSAHIDASGGLTIGEGVVISVNVILLTHDWSFLKRYMARKVVADGVYFEKLAFKPVCIGAETFIGAGAIILPGTTIGKFCIVGAGAVVKGDIPDYAIVVGNPATCIGDTRDEKFKLVVDNP